MIRIRSPRNAVAGLFYIFAGSFILSQALHNPIGTLRRMDSGDVPAALSVILIALGLISLICSISLDGEPVEKFNLRSAALVSASILVFALTLQLLGVVASLVALVLVAASASKEFKLSLVAVAGMAIFIAVNVFVFVKLLGVPLPIWGSLFRAG